MGYLVAKKQRFKRNGGGRFSCTLKKWGEDLIMNKEHFYF
jgi:hypothetical protein